MGVLTFFLLVGIIHAKPDGEIHIRSNSRIGGGLFWSSILMRVIRKVIYLCKFNDTNYLIN